MDVSTQVAEEPTPMDFALSEPWPQPAHDVVRFKLSAGDVQDVTLRITDMLGRPVKNGVRLASMREDGLVLEIPTSSLSPGTYFVHTMSKNGEMIVKRIVVR
jgi:hypothetical protein